MVDFKTTASGDIVLVESKQQASITLNVQSSLAGLVLQYSTSKQDTSRPTEVFTLTYSTDTAKDVKDVAVATTSEATAQIIEWSCKTELGEIASRPIGSDVYKAKHKRHNIEEEREALRLRIENVVARYTENAEVSVIKTANTSSAFYFNTYSVTIEAEDFTHAFQI